MVESESIWTMKDMKVHEEKPYNEVFAFF